MAGIPIPLGVGAYLRTVSGQPEAECVNFYIEKDMSGGAPPLQLSQLQGPSQPMMHIQRPGLATYQTITGAGGVRGLGYAQGVLSNKALAVVYDKLYSFDNTASTILGTVANDNLPVEFAFTNFGVAVLSAGNLYFYQTTDNTFHAIGVPTTSTVVSITSIDSYIIVGCLDGTWYWVVPGDLTIDPTHFADNESMPDNLVGIRELHDEVFMFGASSIEVWGTTGQADLIMEPAPGRRIDHGALSRETIRAMDNTLYFLADNGQVMRLENGEPIRVSNASVEERIRLRGGAPTALVFQYEGHTFYILNIPGQGSFGYDLLTETWTQFLSPQLSTGWLPSCAVMVGDKAYLGSSTSGKVFNLDSTISTDDGSIFTRVVSGVVAFGGGRQRNDNIEVRAGASGTTGAALRLRWRDGNTTTWGSYVTGTIRNPNDIVRFVRLGAAIPPYRVIELSTVDPAVVRISQAEANTGRAW